MKYIAVHMQLTCIAKTILYSNLNFIGLLHIPIANQNKKVRP